MLFNLFPYEYAKSVFDIDYDKLYEQGIRALIYDIDNTLVHHGEDASPQTEAFFQQLQESGFSTLLLTDNDEERTRRFLKNIHSFYICNAGKPAPTAYQKALNMLGTLPEETVVIGDQMFKDILGANNSGIPSILVKYIKADGERWIGWKRYLEYFLLFLWRHSHYANRLGDIRLHPDRTFSETVRMLMRRELLLCDIHPLFYKISVKKEVLKRHIHNLTHPKNYVKEQTKEKLPVVLYRTSSGLIKRGKGIDPVTQKNKAVNIAIACRKLTGVIIHPGEVFSFWRLVGPSTRKRGYKSGRVIIGDRLITRLGGGLCNLANTLHLMVLHSPLDVTEVHYHSDALAADHGKRIPLSSGTSVSYNYIDFCFQNNTDQDFQIRVGVKDEQLIGEIRCMQELPVRYRISEEDHHFRKKGGKYYRVSRIYRDTIDPLSGKIIKHRLIRDNHSEVMFPYEEIPKELIRS